MGERELLQERYKGSPWMLLACCVLCNQTKGTQVDTIVESFFKLAPTPRAYRAAMQNVFRAEDLRVMLQKLGFQHRRASTLWYLASDLVAFGDPETRDDVLQLRGCGDYAADSWQIFIQGADDVEPEDKELRAYLEVTA